MPRSGNKPGLTRRLALKGATAAIAAPAILRHTRSYAQSPTIRAAM